MKDCLPSPIVEDINMGDEDKFEALKKDVDLLHRQSIKLMMDMKKFNIEITVLGWWSCKSKSSLFLKDNNI